MKLTISTESAADIPAINTLLVAAFLHAPYANHREAAIVQLLRQKGELKLALVAKEGDEIVGYIAASPVRIPGCANWFGIGPLATNPTSQDQGIGSTLVREILLRLRAQDAAGCVVLGEPEYYRRFGFKAEPGLVLPGAPEDYFLAVSFSGNVPRGEVHYSEAFSADFVAEL